MGIQKKVFKTSLLQMASSESKSSATEDFSAIFSEKLIGELGAKALDFGLRLVFALVVIFIGLIIIKIICWVVGKILQRKKMDATIRGFLLSLLKGILKIVLLTIVMDILGMEVVSFVALIGALGLAVGLSLGSIASNAVAGFFILINKPFVVGEYVEAAGVSGTVFLIEIFATTLLTPVNSARVCVCNIIFLPLLFFFFFFCFCRIAKRLLCLMPKLL